MTLGVSLPHNRAAGDTRPLMATRVPPGDIGRFIVHIPGCSVTFVLSLAQLPFSEVVVSQRDNFTINKMSVHYYKNVAPRFAR